MSTEANLLRLRDAVTALLGDLRDDDGCTVCGEDEECTKDCTAAPVRYAYALAKSRRVPGRPAGQRIADEPTAEAREVLGLDVAATVPDETIQARLLALIADGCTPVELCYHPDADPGNGAGWSLLVGDRTVCGTLDTLFAEVARG